MGWHWLTAQAGRADKTCAADAGQRGWRLHLVYIPRLNGKLQDKGRKAVCGLRPWKGWGLDLFIDEPCARCERWLSKRPGLEKHIPKLPD